MNCSFRMGAERLLRCCWWSFKFSGM